MGGGGSLHPICVNLLAASAASSPPDTPLRLGNGITVRGSARLEVRTEFTGREHTQRREHARTGGTTHSLGKKKRKKNPPQKKQTREGNTKARRRGSGGGSDQGLPVQRRRRHCERGEKKTLVNISPLF